MAIPSEAKRGFWTVAGVLVALYVGAKILKWVP